MRKKTKQTIAVIGAYQRLFNTDDGKVVLKDLAKASGFTATSFVDSPYSTAFNEGARTLFLRIVQTINTNIDELVKLLENDQNEGED